jgi:hypothetical protein
MEKDIIAEQPNDTNLTPPITTENKSPEPK